MIKALRTQDGSKGWGTGPRRATARLHWGLAGTLVAWLAVLPACSSGEGGGQGFEPARTYEPVGKKVRWDATSSERFGVSSKDFAQSSGGPAQAGMAYTVPPGWSELPKSQFREANFRVAGDPNSECYLTTLGGEGGGLAANVNRWRTQMSLAPMSPEELARLPQVDWLGGRATSVDFTGTWTGMSGDHSAEGWRLVGYLLVEPSQSRFLKMTGPGDVLERELPNFRDLAASFREGGAPADGAAMAPSGELPAGHPPLDGAQTPKAGQAAGGAPGAGAAAVVAGNRSASGFEWTPPAGWRRGAEKSMREITYVLGQASEGGEAECYVTLLSGSGGGMLANVNRWCGQMGQAPLTEEDLSKLARVPMLGAEATLLELERGASSSTAPEFLLGAVCLLPERSIFVKLTGPRALLERERTAFQEFCKSARDAN
jgi:hypothetical protein